VGTRDEVLRQEILRRLQAKDPWRTIMKELGVSSSLIQDVGREAGLLQPRHDPPEQSVQQGAPPERSEAREQSAQRGASPERSEAPEQSAAHASDGMTEYLSGYRKQSASPAAKQLPNQKADLTCPHCGAQLRLDTGESAPKQCPLCDQDMAEAPPDGQCAACKTTWRLDAGEAQPETCPGCGARFA